MWFVLALKLVAVGYAGVHSTRARFYVGIGSLVVMLYCAIARALLALPPHVNLPFGSTLDATWWSTPALLGVLSTAVTLLAFRRSSNEPQESPRREHLEACAFAFLGNALLDVAVLCVLSVAHVAAGVP